MPRKYRKLDMGDTFGPETVVEEGSVQEQSEVLRWRLERSESDDEVYFLSSGGFLRTK
jgi:hypothetical protein